jgi:DNA-binding winged helix-turn-helix (wHTH) protein
MGKYDSPLPLFYRSDLLRCVMPPLRAGECCSLVGVSGVGKSNLVRFLRCPDVQEHYWGANRTWVVVIDTHGLVFGEWPSEYVVAELMIHRLIMEAESHELSREFISELDDLYTRLIGQPSAHLALRYLERICRRLCEALEIQLVFIFDQFEDLWKALEPRFFLNLRNLRDQFKYRVVYLVITRERLQRIRQHAFNDLRAVEAFWELFTSHIYGLGMYSEADANMMLDRIASRQGISIEERLRQAALEASGRHAGLLRAIFWAQHNDSSLIDDRANLLQVQAVAEECTKIWDDLTTDEQHYIQIIAADLPLRQPENIVLADMQLKEIITGEPPTLFSPLFKTYVLREAGLDVAGVVVAPRLRQVWLDGQPIGKSLSPLEFSLLEYLARHAGTVCKREDIMRELYKDEAYNANDERLDTVLRRLREALNEDARNARYLITHRRVGVQLVRGQIQE